MDCITSDSDSVLRLAGIIIKTLHTPTGVDLVYMDKQIVTQLSRPGVIIAPLNRAPLNREFLPEKGAV